LEEEILNLVLRDSVKAALSAAKVEFRRGLSGGGNQLRQPYLRLIVGNEECEKYPVADHAHFFVGTLATTPI